MDALSPSHPSEQVVLMSGAELGKTSILENFIGYIIGLDPRPVLLVEPREADCEAFSKGRLAPMLRDCSTLRGKVADVRSRDSNNTILHKKFTGGRQVLRWSNVEWLEGDPEQARYRCEVLETFRQRPWNRAFRCQGSC